AQPSARRTRPRGWATKRSAARVRRDSTPAWTLRGAIDGADDANALDRNPADPRRRRGDAGVGGARRRGGAGGPVDRGAGRAGAADAGGGRGGGGADGAGRAGGREGSRGSRLA